MHVRPRCRLTAPRHVARGPSAALSPAGRRRSLFDRAFGQARQSVATSRRTRVPAVLDRRGHRHLRLHRFRYARGQRLCVGRAPLVEFVVRSDRSRGASTATHPTPSWSSRCSTSSREWAHGRYAHFRRFSWLTGVFALWLLFASGIGGFWLVWDRLAQYSLIATTEWLDALPVFGGALIRNFIAPAAVSDRLFSLLIFLHIGLPLALLATMWVHLQRLSRPASQPPRACARYACGVDAALARSARRERTLPPHSRRRPARSPSTGSTSASTRSPIGCRRSRCGSLVAGFTLLLSRAAVDVARRAHAAAGCRGRRSRQLQRLRALLRRLPVCGGDDAAAHRRQAAAAAGGRRSRLCAGLRHLRRRVSVVDAVSVVDRARDRHRHAGRADDALRAGLEAELARRSARHARRGHAPASSCSAAAQLGSMEPARIADARTAALPLICAAQLPPSFVEYALRAAPTASSSPDAATATARSGSATAGPRSASPARANRIVRADRSARARSHRLGRARRRCDRCAMLVADFRGVADSELAATSVRHSRRRPMRTEHASRRKRMTSIPMSRDRIPRRAHSRRRGTASADVDLAFGRLHAGRPARRARPARARLVRARRRRTRRVGHPRRAARAVAHAGVGQPVPGRAISFTPALVAHVDLSVLVWFVAFAGALWSLNSTPRMLPHRLGRAGARGARPARSSPSRPSPAARRSWRITCRHRIAAVPRRTGVVRAGCSAARRRGACSPRRSSAFASTAPARCASDSTARSLPPPSRCSRSPGRALRCHGELDAKAYYELLFWGGGHVLQFAWTLLLLVAWLLLADAIGARVPLSPRVVPCCSASASRACSSHRSSTSPTTSPPSSTIACRRG